MSANNALSPPFNPKRKLDSTSDSSISAYLTQRVPADHLSNPNGFCTKSGELKRQKTAPSPPDNETRANMSRIHGTQQRSQGFKGFAASSYQPSTGAKILTVTNLRKRPRTDSHEYYNRTWNQLEACLVDIFAGRQPQQSLEQLYKGVQDICRQGDAEKLFRKLRDRCEAHLTDEVLPALDAIQSRSTNIDILRHVYACWQEFYKQMVGLSI